MPPAARRKRDDGRRPDVEKWLTDNGVDWRYAPDEPMDTVDIEKSLQNQARVFEPLDLDLVKQYAEGVRHGDPFPAMVVHQPAARSNSRTEPKRTAIDGNSLCAASTDVSPA